MKKFKISMIVVLVSIVLFAGNVNAQNDDYGIGYTTTQVIRNTAPVTYTVNNPNGASATFTWTVTGGTIVVGGVDRISPYTQVGSGATESIQVRWDNTNTTSVNNGTLSVSKAVTTGSNTCNSAVQNFAVQSWVAPSATSSTADFSVCGGTNLSAYPIDLAFTGKSDYRYAWQLVRNSDNTAVASSAGELISASATATVAVNYAVVAGETYTFSLTYMYDDFTDFSAATSGNVSTATVAITALAAPVIGPVQSSDSLTERP
jgi:hypothetical protein